MYDLYHWGHAQLLYQAKNYFPGPTYVIAGVNATEVARQKRQPIMGDFERVRSVQHCRYVDEVLAFSPYYPTLQFVLDNKIDFVMHDPTPYPWDGMDDMYGELKELDIFIPSRRTESVSTTHLCKIIKSLG